MKKVLVALLAVVAMLAFTVSAFALHGTKDMFEYTPSVVKSKKAQIELSGSLRARGEMADNTSDFRDWDDGASDDDKVQYDSRARLKVQATVSPNTMGVIEFENGNGGSDSWVWGTADSGNGVYNGVSNAKPDEISLRQAYIAHQGTDLGVLAGFKVGHMLLGLGNGLFYDHTKGGDDAIVLWMQPADNTEVALTIIKLQETAVSNAADVAAGNGATVENGSADDADAYVLSATTAMSGINISGDVTLLQDNSVHFGSDKGLTLWNLGVRADADISGINISGDVEFQTGTIEDYKASGDDMDLSGLALELEVSAKVGDVNVHGGFAYGSGDDKDSEDSYEGFITSLSAGQHYTYLYDQKAKTSAQGTFSTGSTVSSSFSGSTNTGLANTWYLNAGASANVNPDTKVSADVYYLQASQEVADDTIDGQDSQDIGVEIDGKVTYQIDTNLVWFVEAGYLFAGDFYSNVTTDKDEIDNPWSVRHGVVLSF